MVKVKSPTGQYKPSTSYRDSIKNRSIDPFAKKDEDKKSYNDPLKRQPSQTTNQLYSDPIRNRGGAKEKYQDPLRNREPARPIGTQPYKPTNVGIYGEKRRAPKPRPNPKPVEKKKIPRKQAKTFDCYALPKGPDIKLNDMGPEYKPTEYKQEPYKPYTPMKLHPGQKKPYVDPLKSIQTVSVVDREIPMYEGVTEYKLTEENNSHMRNWHHDGVEDTVASHKTHDPPDKKYVVKEKPKKREKPKVDKAKPAEAKTESAPKEVAAKTKTPPPPRALVPVPVPAKSAPKVYKDSSTQHQAASTRARNTQTEAPKNRTFATQSDTKQTKTTSIQTNTLSPLPPVVAPLVNSEPPTKVRTRTTAVQCTEPPAKVTVRGTQYEAAGTKTSDTQTSPIIFENPPPVIPYQERYRTPPRTLEEPRRSSPQTVYEEQRRRTPSPEIVPVVINDNGMRRSPTPKQRTPSPLKQPTPKKPVTPIYTPTPEPIYKHPTPSPEPIFKHPSPEPVYKQPTPEPVYKRPTPDYKHPSPEPVYRNPTPEVPRQYRSPEKNQLPATPSESPKKSVPTVIPISEFNPESYSEQPKTSSKPQFFKSPTFSKSRLPPEVNSLIEAYATAHMNYGQSLGSIQRSLQLT